MVQVVDGPPWSSQANEATSPIFDFLVPTESPTDVYARPVSSTEALVWWLPVTDTGTGLQQYIEGYQVQRSEPF